MPYDILQLNDMLVPELIDVADSLNIQNARSPKHLGRSVDARMLGVGLLSVIFRAATAEAERQTSECP